MPLAEGPFDRRGELGRVGRVALVRDVVQVAYDGRWLNAVYD